MAPANDPTEHTAVAFSIPFARYLAADGTVQEELPDFARDPANLVPLYRAMVLTRIFDEKAVALQRTGRLGTYASSLGQEAVGVGAASAMRPEDVLLPSFREQSAQFWRGVALKEVFLYWGGDERGSDFKGPREDFPVCIPVASHFPHAAGIALAFQLREERRVAVCIAGDGATSKGDFYEGINIAAVWNVPAVFIINDNQWAISVPRTAQTAAKTLAQKAIAAGMPGEQVDGNDVIAVRDAVSRAVERARDGGGPTLIEALTYRLTDHTTADDAHRYREDAEVSAHWKEEPVARLRAYLVSQKAWSKQDEEKLLADCAGEVDRAADDYLAMEPEPVADIFDYLFAELPDDLKAQRAFAIAHIGENPDG
ncbi:MAG: pyruvate dehydrogenase (acetyl-transferring) E1 component subunit alpha [Hyphomicrobiales bacterium]|nr:pyruvate dehydrogenase (acetyl-transferring) E1 component subunit alpha [Hyphomicrobiales bacterium]